MKRFLLQGLLLLTAALPASAEYVKPTDESFSIQLDSGNFNFQVISREDRTVNISSFSVDENVETLTIPSTAIGMVWNEETQDYENVTYRVVQWSGYGFGDSAPYKKLVIPGTLDVIDANVFSSTPSFLTDIVIEYGENPLEIYPTNYFYSDPKVETLEIDRSIKIADNDIKNSFSDFNQSSLGYALPAPTTDDRQNFTIKIGKNIQSFEGAVFKNVYAGKVEIADWTHWYNDVVVDNFEGVPYRRSQVGIEEYYTPELWCGGYRVTTVEIPADTVEIPAFKNSGLTFSGEIIFPSTLKSIGEYAFQSQKDLSYVEFPEGLESIGRNAFDGCAVLTFDGFPSTLRTIGQAAFRGCESQTSIVLPEQLDSLGYGAFQNMSSLKKAVLFCNIDSVPGAVCASCRVLTQVFLPKGAKIIGDYAFKNNYALDEIVLPQGLEKIGTQAFKDGAISKIVFPASLREIGKSAFQGNPLRHLECNEGLEIIEYGAFYGCNDISSISFPSTLKSIGGEAFGVSNNYFKIIAKVEIPSSVKNIGEWAFNCSAYAPNNNIGEMIVGDGITEIPSRALGLPAILTLGENVKSIQNNSFGFVHDIYGKNIQNLRILRLKSKTPPTVSEAFDVTDEIIDKLTVIVPDGSKARYTTNARWKIFNIIEESESNIQVHVTGEYAITEEIRVQSGVMPSMVSKMKVTGKLSDSDWRLIRENMVSLISLDLSGISNTVIPADAFKDMNLLTEIILPANITEIGDNAFYGCTLVDTPELPENVTKIGEYAFYNCQRLSITKLPDALESMGYCAFMGCTSLRSIIAGENLANSVSGTSGMYGDMLFSGCTSLEYVDLSKTKITKIGDRTFEGCTSLTTVVLPDCLTEIQAGAFLDSSLESIDIPASVTSIGAQAFSGTKLRVVNIPSGVTEIYESTFSSCGKLLNVNFPATLKSIGTNVMNGSTKVTGITCAAIDAPEAATGAFNTLSARRCSLTVPTVSFRSYLNAPQWGIFANLLNRITVEMPEKGVDVTYIDEQEYQDIQEEERLREEAESGIETETPVEPETPEESDVNGDESGNEPVKMAEKIAKSNVAAAKIATRAMMQDGSRYARLFDGATLGSPNTEMGTRVFINVLDNTELVAVYLDNKDVTDQLEGNSLLLPSRANGSLRIEARNLGGDDDDDKSLIETIGEDDVDVEAEYYTLQGVRVANPGHGIYIKRQGSKVTKVVL